MIAADIKTIQYREKEKHGRDKYQECLEIRKMTEDAGVVFIVNDDAALALSVKADGVHIGQDDLPFHKVRELTGGDMIIGFSTHSPRQAGEAVAMGAELSYIFPARKQWLIKNLTHS